MTATTTNMLFSYVTSGRLVDLMNLVPPSSRRRS